MKLPCTPALAALATVLALPGTAAAIPHPSLLFSEADLPAIQAKLRGPLAPVRAALVVGVEFPYSDDPPPFPRFPDLSYDLYRPTSIGDTTLAYAFAARAFEDDPQSSEARHARTLALSYLNGICSWDDWVFADRQDGPAPDLNSAHLLLGAALAYDWLYPLLSEAERQTCRDRVAVEGQKMYEASLEGAWWADEFLQNHHWINHAALGLAAL